MGANLASDVFLEWHTMRLTRPDQKSYVGTVVLILILIIVLVLLCGLVRKPENAAVAIQNAAEKKYANDPVMLYQTAGIKGCGYDTRFRGSRFGAALLEEADVSRAMPILASFALAPDTDDVAAILYVNRPEATSGRRGQPALLPLKKEPRGYCALGSAGSYSVPFFLELEEKYQDKISYHNNEPR